MRIRLSCSVKPFFRYVISAHIYLTWFKIDYRSFIELSLTAIYSFIKVRFDKISEVDGVGLDKKVICKMNFKSVLYINRNLSRQCVFISASLRIDSCSTKLALYLLTRFLHGRH